MMYGFGFGPMDGWWLFGGGMMLIFWVVMVLLVILIVKALSGRREMEQKDSAIDILKERYAKGEIGKEEFEAKKKDLSS